MDTKAILGLEKFAIMMVGLPGMGKTTIGRLVERAINNLYGKIAVVYVDQDQFVGQEKPAQKYLDRIEQLMRDGCIPLLGKCHHNRQTRQAVYDVICKMDGKLYIFNLMPWEFNHQREFVISTLLKRIDLRPRGMSSLQKEDAPNALRNVFAKQYEPVHAQSENLDGRFVVNLNYTDPPMHNARKIVYRLCSINLSNEEMLALT
jgi:tRNA splicing ligase